MLKALCLKKKVSHTTIWIRIYFNEKSDPYIRQPRDNYKQQIFAYIRLVPRKFEAGTQSQQLSKVVDSAHLPESNQLNFFRDVSKVMASLVYQDSSDCLLFINFSPQKHSFSKGHSCTADLLNTLDRWATVSHCKGKVHVIYHNFEKTFSGFSHICLIIRLKLLCIKSPFLRWLTTWLNNFLFVITAYVTVFWPWNIQMDFHRVHF